MLLAQCAFPELWTCAQGTGAISWICCEEKQAAPKRSRPDSVPGAQCDGVLGMCTGLRVRLSGDTMATC